MSLSILLIRHGETEWNTRKSLQGHIDIPLNLTGHAQAVATGSYIRTLVRGGTPAIVSSDLMRARATAEAIATALGSSAPLQLDARFRETHLGSWQGRSWEDVEATSGDDLSRWRREPDFPVPGGGESVRQRFARVVRALHEAALRGGAAGVGVVIVAHGGVIDDIGRLVTSCPFGTATGLRKHNCSVSTLHFEASAEAASLAAAGDDSALRAYVEAALPSETVEPHSAASALGSWTIGEWGSIDHLEGLSAPALADPLADSALFSGGEGVGESEERGRPA